MDTPLISLTGLKKYYPSGDGRSLVLNHIDLEIARASMTVIRGISGSGKTTLLNILGGLDRVDEGQVRVGDALLDAMGPVALTRFRAERVGFIFQFHNLIPTLTVKENALTGLEPIRTATAQDHRRAEEYLHKVGLQEHAEKFPAKLSGGQQQRVAIARALIKEPQLILADKPTGSRDEDTGMRVFELLRQMQERTGDRRNPPTTGPWDSADQVYECAPVTCTGPPQNTLVRHVLRSILVIRYRLLTIALICASTFGVLVGACSAIDSLFNTVEDIQSSASMAGLEVIFAPDEQINPPAFDDIPGASATYPRLLMPGLVPLGGEQPVAALTISSPAQDFSTVNRLKVLEGRLPDATLPPGWCRSELRRVPWQTGRRPLQFRLRTGGLPGRSGRYCREPRIPGGAVEPQRLLPSNGRCAWYSPTRH